MRVMQMEKTFLHKSLLTKAPYPPLKRSPFPDGEGLSRAALRTEYKKGDARSALGERVSRLCFLSSTA